MGKYPPWDKSPEAKAWAEGFNSGWSAGWEQGLTLTTDEIARRMIRDDIPLSCIMKYTSLLDGYLTKEFKEIMKNEGRVVIVRPERNRGNAIKQLNKKQSYAS